MDDFAMAIENINKVVFSTTMKRADWKNTVIAQRDLRDEVQVLKQKPGKNILAGSPSIIARLTEFGLVDEYQLCVQPIVLGKGLILFKDITHRVDLKLVDIKRFKSGVCVLYYNKVSPETAAHRTGKSHESTTEVS
jgi:dihydrofolate reductase